MDRRLRLIIDELSHNHSTKLRLPELAAKVDLSVRRLEQLFVEETGMTYVAFRRQLRMQLAEKLLRRSGKPVNEVTAAVGYRAAAYFCMISREGPVICMVGDGKMKRAILHTDSDDEVVIVL